MRKHEIDPQTGLLKEFLKPTDDPRCNCPRACLFHGTVFSPHDGAKAQARRRKQLAKVPFTCPDCGTTHPGTQRNLVPNTIIVVCDYCFKQRSEDTVTMVTQDLEIREVADDE